MPSTADPPLYDLVVIGSSAGGVEALTRLVATLPAAFPAPIVLAQHLDPARQSRLGEILSRRTTLAVQAVEEGPAQPLRPATIYVVPADRDVEITDDAVRLRDGAPRHPKPSIDLLLHSAARAHGERTIAVILTGTGSDGAAGAREVKAAGGMVIVENPETAAYPSMPASLAPSTVDLTVDLERIGPLLFDVLTGAYSVPSPTAAPDGSFEDILAVISEHTGIDFRHYKQATILRRIQRRMAATGMRTLGDYAHYVVRQPEEFSRLAASFLIHVTEFFRDNRLYTYLREQVIPDLIAHARAHGGYLRIWSAGCATGEEPYTLAILIAEALGSELERLNVQIFATDADANAISFARRGIYPPEALAAVPSLYRGRYFVPVEGGYLIDRRVRGMVVFGEHDLGKRAPYPQIDLVLCRNVLIYFTQELQRRSLQLFAFSLRHDGYLVLGTSESTNVLPEYFATVERRLKVYRRQGGRLLVTPLPRVPVRRAPLPAGETPGPTLALQPSEPEVPAPEVAAANPARPQRQQSARQKLGDQVLGLSSTGVVVVDRNYDVQVINSAAYTLLDIVHAAHGKDLLHLAERVPTKPLRAAIDAALSSAPSRERQATLTFERGDGEARSLHIVCYPHASPPVEHEREVTVDAVILFITDVTGEEPRLPEAAGEHAAEIGEPPPAEVKADGRRRGARQREQQAGEMERLVRELEQAQTGMRELRKANQELRDANQELLRNNDDLMLRQEEGQAAAEQTRTLNEELHAINEELETVNEEMEATLEQLRTTNEDLRSRSQELQALLQERETQRQQSERERARLAAILAGMSDALFVVDADGTVVLTNPAYDQVLGTSPAPVLEDVDGTLLAARATPQQRVLAGAAFTMEFVLVGSDGTRRQMEARGEPIRGEDGAFSGAVVAIRDITERTALAVQEQFLTLVSHELRNLLVPPFVTLQVLQQRLGHSGRDATAHQMAARALRGVELLRAMVDDLSDLARARHGKLVLHQRRVDLAALTRQVVDDLTGAGLALGESPRITLQNLPESAEALWMSGDPTRLEQILYNLLTNALTHTPESAQVHVTLERKDGWAELRVHDEGPGIPAADRPYVFAPYFQAMSPSASVANRGLGLGLFIAAELVRAHGGTIAAESPPTGGALFVLRFPLEGTHGVPAELVQGERVSEHAIVHPRPDVEHT